MKKLQPFSGSDGFTHVLLASIVFYLRLATKTRPLLPTAVAQDLPVWVTAGREFCSRYKISTRAYDRYTQLLAAQPTQDTIDDYLFELISAVRAKWKSIQADTNLSYDQIAGLKDGALWLFNESPNALARLEKNLAKYTRHAGLLEAFRKDTEDQSPYIKELVPLVKKLGGTGKPLAHELTIEEARAARERKPDLYKKYLELSRMVRGIYKQNLMNMVRDNGGPVDIGEARRALDAAGVIHKLIKGFTGLVDEDGTLYTKSGRKINGVPQFPVQMNKSYKDKSDDTYVMTVTLPTLNAEGKPNVQYFYTVDFVRQRTEKKYKIASILSKNQDKYRARWFKDMKSDDPDKWVMAVMTELAYTTCARIGKVGAINTKGATFGLSSWLVGNVKRRGASRVIDYIGKDGVHQVHTITPTDPHLKIAIKLLDRLVENKQRKDLLFEYEGTYYSAARMRLYFKALTKIPDVSVHKIRTMRGTALAEEQLDKLAATLESKQQLTQAIVDKSFKEALMSVGQLLGHIRSVGTEQKVTWSTASQSYVDPGIQIGFYERFADRGVRVPRFLQRALKES